MSDVQKQLIPHLWSSNWNSTVFRTTGDLSAHLREHMGAHGLSRTGSLEQSHIEINNMKITLFWHQSKADEQSFETAVVSSGRREERQVWNLEALHN